MIHSEPEKMLKDCTEAATEELSRKEIELGEVKKKNEMIETQRNKKKSEEAQKEVEKIKKMKNEKDDDLRKHTEENDGKNKGRVVKHAEKEVEAERTALKKIKSEGEN